MTSKRIEKKKAKANGLLEEIKSYEYKPEPKEKISVELTEDDLKMEQLVESNQKLIGKNEEISKFLEEQGLGQNARRKVFVLFDELRKLKCPKKYTGQQTSEG